MTDAKPPRLGPVCVISVKALIWLALAAYAMIADQPALASTPDWPSVSEVEEIQVLTTDPDGQSRETTIWLIVVGDRGYIRTSSRSSWGDDIERNSEISLRIEGEEYPLRATFIEEEALREKIVAAFREKYGRSDAVIDIMRGSTPRIMLLEEREE